MNYILEACLWPKIFLIFLNYLKWLHCSLSILLYLHRLPTGMGDGMWVWNTSGCIFQNKRGENERRID